MKVPGKYFLFLSFLLIWTADIVFSADTLNITRSKLYFDNLSVINIWNRSSNPAGLVFLENLKRTNLVEVNYNLDKKELKFPSAPGLTSSFNADTRGLGRLGKLSFSGYFGYKNEQYNNLLYNNTLIFDSDNPYILGDTVGGKQQKEGFILKGAIAYPLSSRISFGVEIDYQNYVGAKLKDPRNKNDISSLVLTPGVILKAGNFAAGISGGPVITNNDISVSVTENAKYSLLQFLGSGYYKPILNIYSYSNTYYGNGYNTQAQLKYEKGNYSNYLVVSFNSLIEEVRYGSSNRLIDGISNRKVLAVYDNQTFKRNNNLHQLDISFKMIQIHGTEVMQHFESVIAGSYHYDTLIIDKWTEGKHIATNYEGSLEYTWSGYKGEQESFRMNAGISGEYMSVNHYPVQTNGFQKVINLIPYAEFRKYLIYKSFVLIPELGIKYRTNLLRDKQYVVTKWYEPQFTQLDYIARSSNFIQGKAAITLIKKTKSKNIPEYFIDLYGKYTYFPVDIAGSAQNILINTTVGLIF
jgi:hypothetical protein